MTRQFTPPPEHVSAPLDRIIARLGEKLRTEALDRIAERTEFRESLGAALHALRDHEVRFIDIGDAGSPEDSEILKEIREGYRHLFTAHQLLKGTAP
jgi:hypothetical protein|tara:strand:- start:444 stop:734 length:291 start_codon:yes stop_codon:yes gene_type:complete